MKTPITNHQTIGEIVAENYHAAAVFEKHEIDYCCGGKKTLVAVCKERHLDLSKLLKEIEETTSTVQMQLPSQNAAKWNLSFLINYIIETHHQYVKESIPTLLRLTEKIAAVHGKNHPELIKVQSLFKTLSSELTVHLQKEEKVLFPYINRLLEAKALHTMPNTPAFKTIQHPLQVLEHEHDEAGAIMLEIRQLCHHYTPPADACTTYKVALSTLHEFETDLHLHVHLENNILFPKAQDLENELLGGNVTG